MMETTPAGATYELWDLDTRNIVGEFVDEGGALALVRALAEEQGRAAASALALVREDEHGDSTTVAMGAGLVDLALPSGQQPSAARAS